MYTPRLWWPFPQIWMDSMQSENLGTWIMSIFDVISSIPKFVRIEGIENMELQGFHTSTRNTDDGIPWKIRDYIVPSIHAITSSKIAIQASIFADIQLPQAHVVAWSTTTSLPQRPKAIWVLWTYASATRTASLHASGLVRESFHN